MGKYIALYLQYHVIECADFDSLNSAIQFLEDGANDCLLLQVAVIDRDSKEIKWQANIFPETEIKQINEFIKKRI